MPFDLETKKPLNAEGNVERYSQVTDNFLMEKASNDSKIVGITAATPGSVGFRNFRTKFAEQYVDVGIAEELLTSLLADHKLVITLEDGILDGGFGEKIARFYGDKDMKVLNFGAKKEFTDSVPLAELYERYHLKEELIVADIKAALK